MNTPNPVLATKTDALKDDLRPCELSPRPIHHPETGVDSRIGGRR